METEEKKLNLMLLGCNFLCYKSKVIAVRVDSFIVFKVYMFSQAL